MIQKSKLYAAICKLSYHDMMRLKSLLIPHYFDSHGGVKSKLHSIQSDIWNLLNSDKDLSHLYYILNQYFGISIEKYATYVEVKENILLKQLEQLRKEICVLQVKEEKLMQQIVNLLITQG